MAAERYQNVFPLSVPAKVVPCSLSLSEGLVVGKGIWACSWNGGLVPSALHLEVRLCCDHGKLLEPLSGIEWVTLLFESVLSRGCEGRWKLTKKSDVGEGVGSVGPEPRGDRDRRRGCVCVFGGAQNSSLDASSLKQDEGLRYGVVL